MEAWIAHNQFIRRLNMTMVSLLLFSVVVAGVVGGLRVAGLIFLVELVAGGLCVGFANVALLLGMPQITATEAEIRAAAESGPKWFKRLVIKLDNQP